MTSQKQTEHSVRVSNLTKIFSLSRKNQNFKELVRDGLSDLFSPSIENDSGNGDFHALNNVSFELDKGDVLGIIGDNGAGKSTLLKIISGVSQPSSGEVAINGKISSILEIGTGFHMELTGNENIFLNGSILGMSKDEIKRQYSNIVAFSGLKDFIHVPIKRYSSGMYLRLAFSVLAHLSAEIILLDEIIYVGDAEFRMKSYNKVKELARSGKTILIVSHDLASVSDLCNKCLLLEKGEVRLSGKTSEIVRQYIDKSLLKYINSSNEDHSRKLQEEMENLQSEIQKMEQSIKEKDEKLNSSVEKEQSLVNEINKLAEESKELNRIREGIKIKSDVQMKNTDALDPEKSWNSEAEAPGTEMMKLKRVSIATPEGKKTFTQSDDLVIEIEYWKYAEDPFIIGLLASYNFSGLAFGTSSSFGAASGLQNRGKGLFKNTCVIQKYMLNEGMFSLSFFFYTESGISVFAIQDALFLKINFSPKLLGNFEYQGNLAAPFAPCLKWT